MRFTTRAIYVMQYEYTGKNQHGERYKKVGSKRVMATTMIARVNHPDDMQEIAILSDQLDTPLKYNFEKSPQEVSIEIVAQRNIS